MNNRENFIINNFDILRLFAALQVVFMHGYSHLEISNDALSSAANFFSSFPGVPIFFFISGYLISKSYISNNNIEKYTYNRILRIYPALIICTFLSILSVYITGYFSTYNIDQIEFMSWLFGQVSFVQFYNPEFMRQFGTGTLNGSLWTITVELQFYFIIPFMYFIISKLKLNINIVLLLLIVLFLLINQLYVSLGEIYREYFLYKLWGVSFAPWLYMFLIGVFFQHNFDYFYKLLRGKSLLLIFIYLITYNFGFSTGNEMHPLLFIVLSFLIFSFAYTIPKLSNSILHKNDISYGVYIYHIPIINLLIYYNYVGSANYFYLMICLVVVISITSWLIIERPILGLKKSALHTILK